MDYVDIEHAITADGLRLVLVRGMPSPWGQAAKAMMEHKKLDYLPAPQEPGGDNAALTAWAGTNSAPVVAWNDEAPLNRWNDILLLLERLAPERPLVPAETELRIELFGLAHELCGELGFGWNCRLNMIRAATPPGRTPGGIAGKYGYNAADAEAAGGRLIEFLNALDRRLEAQAARGSGYLIGSALTAVDFYWAAFSNLVSLQPPEACPLDPAVRPRFEQVPADVTAAVTARLLEHRDRIMSEHFRQPMEM